MIWCNVMQYDIRECNKVNKYNILQCVLNIM